MPTRCHYRGLLIRYPSRIAHTFLKPNHAKLLWDFGGQLNLFAGTAVGPFHRAVMSTPLPKPPLSSTSGEAGWPPPHLPRRKKRRPVLSKRFIHPKTPDPPSSSSTYGFDAVDSVAGTVYTRRYLDASQLFSLFHKNAEAWPRAVGCPSRNAPTF